MSAMPEMEQVAADVKTETYPPLPPTQDSGEDIAFDEQWYLWKNPAVAKAVAERKFKSGKAHYLLYGRAEGRMPVPPPGHVSAPMPAMNEIFRHHNGAGFLNPTDLTVTATTPQRIALVGSCLLESWNFHRKNPGGCPVDLLVFNNASGLPERIAAGVAPTDYDLQVIQIPLRAIFADDTLTGLDFDFLEAHQKAFDKVCQRLEFHLKGRMEWNTKHGLLTFVANFMTPQRNPMGVLFPRFDLRNPEHFIHCLNERLEALALSYRNCFILDLDRISASVGRRYVQDDSISQISHASTLPPWPPVADRMEPMAAVTEHYDVRWRTDFLNAVWSEMISMYHVARQTDAVKLVVMDLDDTMWEGVSGDMADIGPHMLEGWPLGVVEALCYLKKRGVLLAIISKNEESRIRDIWQKIFLRQLKLEDFADVRINWQPKTENMRELLEVVSLLPRNVVFVDDNPAERAAMARAFPEMRIIGGHPYYLRRTLLWSSETQVAALTKEAGRRTEMMQAQVRREGQRKSISREDFLRSAAPAVTLMTIGSIEHLRFGRVFELVNKTNQFNTTGKRWTLEAFGHLINGGATIHAFDVVDSFTDYGLVGVVIVCGGMIEQWVMSCRVLGYQVEEAVMANLVQAMRAEGFETISGHLIETDVNFPCRDLFSRCGFVASGNSWSLAPETVISVPEHITISCDVAASPTEGASDASGKPGRAAAIA